MTKKSLVNNWKPVTIGGMTGIMVGTGATMAYHSIASVINSDEVVDNVNNNPKPTVSNDDMSFPEAFNAARAELGSGKTFEWHGKTYSTCTHKEWKEMVAAESKNTSKQEEETLVTANVDHKEKDETEQPIVKNQSQEEDGQDDVLLASHNATVKNNDATVTVEEEEVKNSDSEQAIKEEQLKEAENQEEGLVADNEAFVKNNEATVAADESSVKDDVATVEADESTVKDDVAAVTADESTVKNDVAAVTADESTVKNDVAAVTADESTVKNDVAAVTADEATVKDNEVTVTVDETAVKNDEAATDSEDVTIKNNPTTESATANVVASPSENSQDSFAWNNVANDEDVRIIGVGDVVLDNGKAVTVQELDVNGQRVAVIDIDQDGAADIAMSDLNHNQQADDGEIVDLHTGESYSLDDQSPLDDVNIELTLL